MNRLTFTIENGDEPIHLFLEAWYFAPRIAAKLGISTADFKAYLKETAHTKLVWVSWNYNRTYFMINYHQHTKLYETPS